MTLGRKPTTAKEIDKGETNEPLAAADMQQAQQLAVLAQGYGEERDLVNQLLGQVQMARSFARFADVVSLSKLKHIKETKMYRALAGKKVLDPDGNEIADVGTFDGFCQALGLSRSKVDEDLANLASFGEEAMKSLSAIGAGYREMRQYRKLPDDQKTALIEVAKTGDKESFVELAEEIIAKHTRDKDSLQKEVEEAKAAAAAKDQVIGQKNEHIAKLVETQNRRAGMTEAETLAELERELTESTLVVIGSLQVVDKHIGDIRALDSLPQGMYVACANALQRIVSEAMGIAAEHGIGLTLAADPDLDGEGFEDPNAGEDPATDWIGQAK